MKTLTPAWNTCVTLAFVALICPQIGHAESTHAPSESAAASAGFQSGGIKAVIISAKSTKYGFSVQMIIQNTRNNTIYISPISGYDMGSGNTAILASGDRLQVGNYGRDFIGLTPCYEQNNIPYDKVVSGCVKSFPLENMTAIEPSQTAVFGVTYGRAGYPLDNPVGDNASFAIKFLFREEHASAKGDPLAAAASGKSDESTAGPPKVVTISFPLIPLSNDSNK